MKHKYDLNKSREFNYNLMHLIDIHRKNELSQESVREYAVESAGWFIERLTCLSEYNQFGYSYIREQNFEKKAIDKVISSIRPHGD